MSNAEQLEEHTAIATGSGAPKTLVGVAHVVGQEPAGRTAGWETIMRVESYPPVRIGYITGTEPSAPGIRSGLFARRARIDRLVIG